jgi:hypothetical protein
VSLPARAGRPDQSGLSRSTRSPPRFSVTRSHGSALRCQSLRLSPCHGWYPARGCCHIPSMEVRTEIPSALMWIMFPPRSNTVLRSALRGYAGMADLDDSSLASGSEGHRRSTGCFPCASSMEIWSLDVARLGLLLCHMGDSRRACGCSSPLHCMYILA